MKSKVIVAYVAASMLLSLSILFGCKKGNEGGSGSSGSNSPAVNATVVATPSFQTNIAPIFSRYCVRCHGSSGAAGGIQLHNYATISANASAALSAIQSGRMPQGGAKLAASDITTLQNWISLGKQNN